MHNSLTALVGMLLLGASIQAQAGDRTQGLLDDYAAKIPLQVVLDEGVQVVAESYIQLDKRLYSCQPERIRNYSADELPPHPCQRLR
jgi:hypothetical protein